MSEGMEESVNGPVRKDCREYKPRDFLSQVSANWRDSARWAQTLGGPGRYAEWAPNSGNNVSRVRPRKARNGTENSS